MKNFVNIRGNIKMNDVIHTIGGNAMLKIGDTVKVISDTVSHWDPGGKD